MQTLVQSRKHPSYDDDLALWIDAQVQLLLDRRFSELDMENLIAELDAMKKREIRALKNRLRVLIMHLLKCRYQPEHPQNKWRATLIEQRERLAMLLEDSPSLRASLPEYAQQAYPIAVKLASAETGLPALAFPTENPFSIDQILDQYFTP
ncbi:MULTISPECIES: DUF29 domain-containing protein [unclassified Duganella]|uniref:DUF29 domain-containing protein n=1 Tax=unclassified Duganella TaxID=2636909 RepID=UPI000E3485A5|nr:MULTISPECIES: DUF29 domain-containing protein [unclassified Duganella]RFP13602.1 DUF29 domain-containing protein [Duganella sp. BJB475]RFP36310.1 DUF29 domain-containing protein [Duganella sp. BJB476]